MARISTGDTIANTAKRENKEICLAAGVGQSKLIALFVLCKYERSLYLVLMRRTQLMTCFLPATLIIGGGTLLPQCWLLLLATATSYRY